MKESKDLVKIFVPSLIVLLKNQENINRGALSEADVLDVVSKAIHMEMPRFMRDNLAAQRGFSDISPDNAWAEWNAYKGSLTESANPESVDIDD